MPVDQFFSNCEQIIKMAASNLGASIIIGSIIIAAAVVFHGFIK